MEAAELANISKAFLGVVTLLHPLFLRRIFDLRLPCLENAEEPHLFNELFERMFLPSGGLRTGN
jgi:hypothetical protein